MLYWNVGKRISEDILDHKRAEYGKGIMESLSLHLTEEYGRGWTKRNISWMVRFYDLFPDSEIWTSLMSKLSWTHIQRIIRVKNPIERDFYIELCKQEKWNVERLNERINSMLYERTTIANNSETDIRSELEQIKESGELTPEFVLRSPYFLDFLELESHFYEQDLEEAILRDMHGFLLELGAGLTFVDKQKRIQIGKKHFYIDLLFFNRKLKRLVCVDLKIDEFKTKYKSQMELYLKWLAKHEMQEDEKPPIGTILCTGKDAHSEEITLLELSDAGIHVAEYLTELPSKEVFQKQLRAAIERTRGILE